MRLALCTHFLDGDIWQERLQAAAGSMISVIEEYGSPEELLNSEETHDGIVVALRGVAGLQAVRRLREEGNGLPLVWIADEAEYALFAYRYQVTFFLLEGEEDDALSTALMRMYEEGAGLLE